MSPPDHLEPLGQYQEDGGGEQRPGREGQNEYLEEDALSDGFADDAPLDAASADAVRQQDEDPHQRREVDEERGDDDLAPGFGRDRHDFVIFVTFFSVIFVPHFFFGVLFVFFVFVLRLRRCFVGGNFLLQVPGCQSEADALLVGGRRSGGGEGASTDDDDGASPLGDGEGRRHEEDGDREARAIPRGDDAAAGGGAGGEGRGGAARTMPGARVALAADDAAEVFDADAVRMVVIIRHRCGYSYLLSIE